MKHNIQKLGILSCLGLLLLLLLAAVFLHPFRTLSSAPAKVTAASLKEEQTVSSYAETAGLSNAVSSTSSSHVISSSSETTSSHTAPSSRTETSSNTRSLPAAASPKEEAAAPQGYIPYPRQPGTGENSLYRDAYGFLHIANYNAATYSPPALSFPPDKNGHVSVYVARDYHSEPDCFNTGVQVYDCYEEGVFIAVQLDTVPYHHFSNWRIARAPTETAAGIKRLYCSNCWEYSGIEETLPPLPSTDSSKPMNPSDSSTIPAVPPDASSSDSAGSSDSSTVSVVPPDISSSDSTGSSDSSTVPIVPPDTSSSFIDEAE